MSWLGGQRKRLGFILSALDYNNPDLYSFVEMRDMVKEIAFHYGIKGVRVRYGKPWATRYCVSLPVEETKALVLHEVAHLLVFNLHGERAEYRHHGPLFARYFYELVVRYMDVDRHVMQRMYRNFKIRVAPKSAYIKPERRKDARADVVPEARPQGDARAVPLAAARDSERDEEEGME